LEEVALVARELHRAGDVAAELLDRLGRVAVRAGRVATRAAVAGPAGGGARRAAAAAEVAVIAARDRAQRDQGGESRDVDESVLRVHAKLLGSEPPGLAVVSVEARVLFALRV